MQKKEGMTMGYEFRQAVRESVGLLIGLIGPSGSGKTFSAMRIAAGIVGEGNRFAVIDTENRRALHYASQFQFDHCELSPPFGSLNFAGAIEAADKAGYKAIVVDSCSHEWASEGGVLDFQEQELNRMAGDDWKKREQVKMAAWIKPKGNHKQMVQRLLRTKAHLILCFRAEEKTKIEKGPDGKTHIIPMGFQPVCSKEFPYELTVSFLLSSDKPGVGQPIKLQEQHKTIFPDGKLLDESAGKAERRGKGTAARGTETRYSGSDNENSDHPEKKRDNRPRQGYGKLYSTRRTVDSFIKGIDDGRGIRLDNDQCALLTRKRRNARSGGVRGL
jgi:hypothetical protein